MALRGGPVRSSASAGSAPGWRPLDFLRFETHFMEEGVVQGVGGNLEVTENSGGANMTVEIAAGLALIEYASNHLSPDETIKTWFYNSEAYELAVPTADSTNPRKDRVVAEFLSVDPNGSASDNVRFRLIEGTPAGSPTAPAEPSNAITLAIVDVPASDTTISNAQITDSRGYVTISAAVLLDIARVADLASNANGKGAGMIGVEDAAGKFSETTVEGVLGELQDNIDAVPQGNESLVHIATADSNDISSGTGYTNFNNSSFDIEPPLLEPGVKYRVIASGTYNGGSDPRIPTLAVRFGTTALVELPSVVPTVSVEFNWRLEAEIVCRAAGAGSGSVQVSGKADFEITTSTSRTPVRNAAVGSLDTTGTITLVLSGKWSGDGGVGRSLICKNVTYERIGPVA